MLWLLIVLYCHLNNTFVFVVQILREYKPRTNKYSMQNKYIKA